MFSSGLTSDSSEHSVRPVRLDRCWAGTVRWSYPRGALRVVFRLTGTSGGREFRVCLKPDRLDGVRVLLDSAPRRLIAVYDYRTAGEPLRSRCFKSVGGTAAFYVEADKTGDRSGPVRFRYDLEPLAEPAPQLFVADNLDDGKWARRLLYIWHAHTHYIILCTLHMHSIQCSNKRYLTCIVRLHWSWILNSKNWHWPAPDIFSWA